MAPRIAYVITTFLRNVNYTRLMALARDQRARGREVEIITGRNASPELMEEACSQGIAVTPLPSLGKYIYPYQDALALRELVRLYRARKFDLVHTFLAKAGILGRLAGRLAGVPRLVHSVFGASFAPTQPALQYVVYRNLERLMGRVTDRFLFVGRELRDTYVAAGVCPPSRALVVYGGRDLSRFCELASLPAAERLARREAFGFREDTIVLGNVSRLVPWKGHGYALQVVRGLRDKGLDVRLIVVGDAKTPAEQKFKHELLARVRREKLEEAVIFTGWQPDPAPYYALFDLYLLTSMPFEGIPGSIIEATIMGVPVVGFDCCGVREIPGVRCRLVPPRETASLTAAVAEETAHLPASRGRWGGARPEIEQIRERFSLAGMVARTTSVYETLI